MPAFQNQNSTIKSHASSITLILTLAIDSCGILLSIMAIVAMVTVKNLPNTFSGTLLSHSVANFIGGLLFLWTTVSEMLHIEIEGMNPTTIISMAISVVLSLSHLLCLVLAEYIHVSGQFKYVTKSFRPLLAIVWFLAICLSSVLFFLDKTTTEFICLIGIIVCWIGLIAFYTSVMKMYRNHRHEIARYSKTHVTNPVSHRDIFFPRVILAAYFFCSLPWAFKEAHYAKNSSLKPSDDTSYYMIVVYSLNFHVVSIICLYLKCRNAEQNIWHTRHYTTKYRYSERSIEFGESKKDSLTSSESFELKNKDSTQPGIISYQYYNTALEIDA
uniref:Uncharacterized protein n=1 Tax=Clytia hemisphaerica TaxID=252671 RepID=A0A7M5V6A5_9CNID